MSTKLSGLNALSYLGVEPYQPPLLIQESHDPTTHDKDYNIGTIWLTAKTFNVWMLASLVNDIAIWIQLAPGSGAATSYVTDSGTATPLAGVLNMFGSTNITTSGAGNTVTIHLSGAVATEYDCNVGIAIPSGGILNVFGAGFIVDTTGAGNTITISMNNDTNGWTLIGGGAFPVFAPITSTGGTIAITHPAPNTINLETTGITPGADTFNADSGSAAFAAGVLNIFGGSNINTSASGNTVITNLDNSVSISGSLTTGTTITAGTGMIVNAGGITSTGTTTLLSLGAGVMQTNALGVVSSTNGTNGQVLIGGGAAPVWNNITSTGGTITITNGANSINLEASGVVPPSSRAAFLIALTSDFIINSSGASAPRQMNNLLGQTWSIIYDNTSSCTVNPVQFTAPISGVYWLEFFIEMSCNYSGFVSEFTIMTAGPQSYVQRENRPASSSGSARVYSNGQSGAIYLFVGQTVTYFLRFQPSVGVQDHTVVGGGPTNIKCWMSGYLAA